MVASLKGVAIEKKKPLSYKIKIKDWEKKKDFLISIFI